MNMKKVLWSIFLLTSSVLSAQYTADIRVVPSTDHGDCYNVELNYQSEKGSKLASQNYRIFYDAELSTFDKAASELVLPDDDYAFSVVQTNHDIDASGVGPLSFEGHLGFINATVLLNDTRLEGQFLEQEKGWIPTIQVCFDMIDDHKEPHIVLARPDLTGSYGRAFVEMSVVDQFDAIQPLSLHTYQDLDR